MFVGTGLPGGLDYAMLVAVKHGCLPALTEKRYNALLNAYVRGPFGAIGAAIAYLAGQRAAAVGQAEEAAAGYIIATASLVNSCFFSKLAVENAAEHAARTASAAAKGIGPQRHTCEL